MTTWIAIREGKNITYINEQEVESIAVQGELTQLRLLSMEENEEEMVEDGLEPGLRLIRTMDIDIVTSEEVKRHIREVREKITVAEHHQSMLQHEKNRKEQEEGGRRRV